MTEEQMTPEQIEEIWISVASYLPERVKLDCAIDYVKTLIDGGVDPEILKQSGEYDEKLQTAIDTVLDDDDDLASELESWDD
jgi:hypothetical protein